MSTGGNFVGQLLRYSVLFGMIILANSAVCGGRFKTIME